MKNIVILISGRGSNMEAVVRACAREGWPARVRAVISNKTDAAGLGFAQANGIGTAVVAHRGFDGRELFDAALAREIDRFEPDLVVLAGFMRVLTDGFVNCYAGRMINVHPSLLPCFPGLRTHQQALRWRACARRHGAFRHADARSWPDRRAGRGAGRSRRRYRRARGTRARGRALHLLARKENTWR